MKRIWIYAGVLLLFAASSCQLKKITLDVYDPPQLELPPQLKLLMVTSRYVPATGPYDEVQWGAFESVDSVKWNHAESMVDSVVSLLTKENRYLVKRIQYPRMFRHNGPDLPEALPWEGMKNETDRQRVEAALVLEGYDLELKEPEVREDAGQYLARREVNLTMAWRMYQPARRRMLEEKVYHWSSLFTARGENLNAAIDALPDEDEMIKQTSLEAAADYVGRFTPGSVAETRFYYPNGDSLMKLAALAVEEDRWGSAETRWYYLSFNSQDSVVKARACYNMALACERDGRTNQALAYARRSHRINPDKRTLEYINILNRKALDYEERIRRGEIIRRW